MKRTIIIATLLVLLATIGLTSCRKGYINGDLDGNWKLRTIERVDGTIENVNGPYFCFYLHMGQLRGPKGVFSANMVYDKKRQITLDFPTIYGYDFASWGLCDDDFVNERDGYITLVLKVKHLNERELVMETKTGTILSCRIY